jgi:uncharacterized protein with GYD domain
MPTYVMLTRLSPDAMRSPESLGELEREAMRSIRSSCDGVEWLHSWAVLGGCDYLDVFEARDQETAMKVATIVRTFGHATTEVWGIVEWKRFKELVTQLPGAGGLVKQR